jgi:hypothetical protein
MSKRLITVFFVLSAAVPLAHAEQLSFMQLRASAERGDAAAQGELGLAYALAHL